MARFEMHSHSDMSNIRLIDCINTVDSLVDYAVEIGLEGICLTDHEALGNWVKLDQKRQKIQASGSRIFLLWWQRWSGGS